MKKMEKMEKDTLNTVLQSQDFKDLIVYAALGIAVIGVAGYYLYQDFIKHSSKKPSIYNKEKLKKAGAADINMDDLMDSINKSKELYKKLSTRCHPDRFVGQSVERNKLANDLFQEITRNKNDYKKLKELKSRAEKELNLTF